MRQKQRYLPPPRRQRKRGLCELAEKKDRSDCMNYKGTFFVAHAGKALFKTVASRLSNDCEARKISPEEQCGFRPAPSEVEVLFVVRRPRTREENSLVHVFHSSAESARICLTGAAARAPAYQRRCFQLFAYSTKACGLASVQTTVSAQNYLTSRRSCGKAACCHRYC